MKLSILQHYQESIDQPEQFWAEAARAIHWVKPPTKILDNSNPPFSKWFSDGELNICYNALDYHIEQGRGAGNALIYDSPVTQSVKTYTYVELRNRVAKIAGMLLAQGVGVGDRVVIYMPMIPETVMAMLACARIGAIHSVVFGGFAAKELATRINDAKPSVVLSASCGIEGSRIIDYKPLLDSAINLAMHKPVCSIIFQREQSLANLRTDFDFEWQSLEDEAVAAECQPVPADHPLYILYTSGTTGEPKGVVHDTGGYAVALKWSMKAIYNCEAGDVFWAASDVGWVVGHSYITYAPLLKGCTTLIYEGKPVGTPNAGAFWRVIEQHRVNTFFTAPTAIRAIKKEDPDGELLKPGMTDSLRTIFLAGERCDPDTLSWTQQRLSIPVIDHWWQTETGWSICANCMGIEYLPVVSGSPTRAVPGYQVEVVNSDAKVQPANTLGSLVCKLPLPPGTFTTLWQNDKRFVESYFMRFPGYYETGDAGYINDDGYVFVMSRTDDIINVAGHRLSTGAIEQALSSHSDVAECAVIGIADKLKGHLPLGLLVLKSGISRDTDEVCVEAIGCVRNQIGPVAAFKLCTIVTRLPKTRSGKILRATMRSIADGTSYKVPATIEDPVVLEEITEALATLGYPRAVQ